MRLPAPMTWLLALVVTSARGGLTPNAWAWAQRPSAHGSQQGSYLTGVTSSNQNRSASGAVRDRGGWVLTAYLGNAWTASSSLKISQPTLLTEITFDGIQFDTQSFDPPIYYGYRVGYFLPPLPFLGLEAEFIHLKVFADPQRPVQLSGVYRGAPLNGRLPLAQIVQEYAISHGVNLLLANVAGRYGWQRGPEHPAGRWIVTGRFGLGPTIPHTESTIDQQHQEQYEVGRVGWQLAGGVEVKLWRGLYALGEYKFTRTRQRGKIFSGRAESLLRSHHGVFGLSYHF